jgi:Na/Pi-cotransporter
MILQILTLAGALGMFLYGMNMMSTGLQKAAGDKLRRLIASMTSNRFKGVLTGLGVTATIQSSSATTVMVVGFVNAGLLTLTQAIGVIMGANIGTTLTAWIIAVFGFKADIAALAVPLMALGFIFSISKKGKRRDIGELVIGFSLLFLGLSLMKSSVPDLRETPQVLEFISAWSDYGFWSVLIFLCVGTVLTLVLQSSSATVALTLIMLNLGWIPFEMACAMVLGENIGTTITANIAAAMGTTSAKRAALAHTVFNVFGVVWALVLFNPFVKMITWIVSLMHVDEQTSLLYGISTLHTVFNIINTCLLIGFVPVIERIVCSVIKGKAAGEENHLQYLNAGLVSAPEFALAEAHKEVLSFARMMDDAFEYVYKGFPSCNDPDSYQPFRDKLLGFEQDSDRMEYEIISFLNNLDKDSLSENSSLKLKGIIRIVGEMESLGDSGESISRQILHMNSKGIKMSSDHILKLQRMATRLSEAYNCMVVNLEANGDLHDISNAVNAEQELNLCRDNYREEELLGIESDGSKYFEGVFFLGILEEMEKMGDYLINISQAALGRKVMDVEI